MKLFAYIMTTILLISAGTLSAEEEQPRPEKKRDIPFEFSLYSPLEIFPGWNETIRGAHLSLLYGRTGDLRGLSLGPAHRVDGSLKGAQIGFFGNVKGDVTGAQMNIVNFSNNVKGFQAAVINLTGAEITGVQLAALNITGVMEEESSGFINAAVVRGLQAGFINRCDEIYGIQAGFINICDRGKGTQVGLINICGEMTGASIGFINIFTRGSVDLSLYSGLNSLVNTSVRSRGKYSYGIFSVGYDPRKSEWADPASFGFGFGSRLVYGDFYADADLMLHFMSRRWGGDLFDMDSANSRGYAAITIRLLPGWQITEWFSLFAGPVCLIYPAVNRDFDVKPGVHGGVTFTIL